MRGRELAAAAAGLPPLDSDQVLDLQRTAGNQLTTGALSRWTDGLGAAIQPRPTRRSPASRRPSRRSRARRPSCSTTCSPPRPPPRRRTRRSAPRSTRSPRACVLRVTCTAAPGPVALRVDVHGPAGGDGGRDRRARRRVRWSTLELPFADAFGAAAQIGPESALALRLTGPDGGEAGVELPVPFVAPRALALGTRALRRARRAG